MALAALILVMPPFTQPTLAQTPPGISIDVPVVLKQVKVVFNMDHAAFSGDTPVGLAHMMTMSERLQQSGTEWKIIGVFHGEAGYMLLDDEKYNAARKTKTGNPYKAMIRTLVERGIAIEECAFTMKANGWRNEDLLPMVKVNGGADLRIVELVQEGYVMLQP
jgi:intracellular sulfur oxidation DsrE/DsrF family protein